MKKEIREIKPGSGLGLLKFGMTRDEVKKIAGKPDEVENLPGFEEEVNDELESWHYDEHEFSLVFDADYDWRLVSIAVSDPFFTFHGKALVGMEKKETMDFLDSLGIEISNVEDVSDEENPNLELIESDEAGIMVWFADGEVIEVQILPDVEEDGETLIWPE
ncbi:MAG: hypothetical protein IPL08_19330 [Saprospiraceae bacterium]|jgi:hypothetical protein|nr:hypothetical protein [Saprospiraceae bacterium]MBK8669404.1 hypothetical protein [Saprospiraceae bacterium]MBL0100740.1 hypothetical protein [Saprospiraceae bacterium]